MQKSEIMAKLNQIYQNIQSLELRPTEHNVMLIADSLLQIKNVYSELQEPEQNCDGVKAEGEDDVRENAE